MSIKLIPLLILFSATIKANSINRIHDYFVSEFETQILALSQCNEFNIYHNPELDYVAAAVGVNENHGDCYVNILNGFASKPNGPLMHTLTICHEMGHFLGGEPYKVHQGVTRTMSAEGRSDEYGMNCFMDYLNTLSTPTVFFRLNILNLTTKERNKLIELCGSDYRCMLALKTAYDYIETMDEAWSDDWHDNFFEAINKVPTERPQTPLIGNRDYPSPLCRFHILMDEVLNENEEHLACWY